MLIIACARDHLYSISPHLPDGYSYAQDGPPCAANLPSPPVIILALHPHFSITKAAGLVGLGAGPRVVQTIPPAEDDELAFNMIALEDRLKKEKEVGRGVIVSYGLGEVNTGGFGKGLDDVARLCRSYDAWLHIDAGKLIESWQTLTPAFGGFAAALPELQTLTKGVEMADSLTLDGKSRTNKTDVELSDKVTSGSTCHTIAACFSSATKSLLQRFSHLRLLPLISRRPLQLRRSALRSQAK